MKTGDLVVHIGAKPNGYRLRLVIAISEKIWLNNKPRETVVFVDGRNDWKDQWKVFDGWKRL